MSWTAVAVLAFVTMQRLVELALANRNARRLLARGALEHGRGHYGWIVAVHAAWLAALWTWAPHRPVDWRLLALFGVLQLGRVWVIATLGERWTTRIIVLPGAPLVTSGPYRFLSHPNYLIVVLEIAALPMAFGLWEIALIFSIANALVVAVRIRAEERALLDSAPPSQRAQS